MVENYEWIYKCILSCKNEAQLLGASRLINLFKELHSNDKGFPTYNKNLWIEWRQVKKAVPHVHESEFAG